MSNPLTLASNLSLKQLTYLLAIAETLNFTRAAEQCFVTQSTLSGGLAELERQLGVKLVERDRQRVALTPIGQQVVNRARALLAASVDLVRMTQESCDPHRGELHLGVIPTIAPFVLGRLLNLLRKACPDLSVAVRESQTHVLLEEVGKGELDAALLALPIDAGKLLTLPLFDEVLQLVAHADDPMVQRKNLKIDHIQEGQLLLLEKGHCLRDHALATCSAQKAASIESHSVEATNLSTMVQLVNAGLGCALLPDMAIRAGILKGTKTVVLPLAKPVPKRTIALVTRASHPHLEFLRGQVLPVLMKCDQS
ncbi:MAG: hydrogen peroxide-inducible genes activator [Limnobacter sp.]|uniref:hydrogen peroxide-inducible genes activator n=1 Tax=Limnobacter sp. TaxID=2003368 RepID=UPI00391C02D1